MKKESNDVGQAPENIPHRYMTEAESQQMTVLANRSFFKEKYRHALKISTKFDLLLLNQTHPEWTIKDVLSTLIKSYDPQLPSSILLEMTQFILAEWEILQTSRNIPAHI